MPGSDTHLFTQAAIAQSYDAPVAHAGGDPESLTALRADPSRALTRYTDLENSSGAERDRLQTTCSLIPEP